MKTTTSHVPSRAQTISTVAILLLGAFASLMGVLRPTIYDELAIYRTALYLQDLIVLLIAVPVLAVGLWLALQGSLRGQIVWLGSLTFMVYLWASQTLVLAYNELFLAHIVLFALSAFTLASAVQDLDAERLAEAVRGRVSRRFYAGFLGLTAVALGIMWLSDLIEPLLAGTQPQMIEQLGVLSKNTLVLDLGLVVPALAIAAIWLFRDRDWGYAAAGILVVFAALLAPGITSMTIALATGGLQMTPALVAGSIVPPVVGLVLAGWYLRAIPRRRRAEPTEQPGIPS